MHSEEQLRSQLFERAVDAVVDGDLRALESYLREAPELATARSDRDHHATLLHYVSANGVEDERQRTPANVVEVAQRLINAGADVDALADVYGGRWTTLSLVASSVHPARAGVQFALIELLLKSGAAVDGVAGEWPPVLAALSTGRGEAAETLARHGARLNLVSAAALGRLGLVRDLVAGESEEHRKKAFLWACQYGRRDVVEYLLEQGVDAFASDEQEQTGLHHAALGGSVDVLKLLINHKGRLEALNVHGGTVLGQAVWTAMHAQSPSAYVPVLEALLEAGADVEAAGYPTGNQVIDEVLRRYGADSRFDRRPALTEPPTQS